jgi:hypothetical protein
MSKTFRAWKIDEALFLPPAVQDARARQKPEIKTYLNGKLVSDIVIDTSPLRTRIAV